MSECVGRVVATEARPSTPHQFFFRAAPDAEVGIGMIVVVANDERTVWGVVVDGAAWGDTGINGDDLRAETVHFLAAVLRQDPPEPIRPVALADVRLASDADVRVALRMDSYATGPSSPGIPAGIYAAGGRAAPVLLDPDFLLGPEAAHLNISGVSGLATKTSAVEFLLQSIFDTLPESNGSVAAICFNVKGPDLCFLDQPASIGPDDRAIYQRLGLEPHPVADFTVHAPFKPDGVNLNTLRTHPDLIDSVQPLVWGLREVLDFAEVVMNRDDIDARADAFIGFLAERVVGREYLDEDLQPLPFQVESFADLEQFFQAIFRQLEHSRRGGEIWRTHHIATIRKVRNRLGNISTRAKGLVTDDGAISDLPWGEFRDRAFHVVDVAGLDPLAQDLVFARIVSKLREHLERRDLGVDQVVVFVDELNKYAPADGADTYTRRMLLDLSERGRYLGLVLFSAQQFRSQVQRRVVGNAGTVVYGRMDMDELATAGYSTLSAATRIKLATLPKGELMLRHPHFTQPVFLRFPRPASLSGREGIDQFPPSPELPFTDAVVQQLRGLDRAVDAGAVRDLVDGRAEGDVRRALAAVRRSRPDDSLAFFRSALGRRAPSASRQPSAPALRPVAAPDDPYA